MKTFLLSGWAQPANALLPLFPQAQSIDYARHGSSQNWLESLPEQPQPDLVIGWSLGGKLAYRAVQAGLWKPKLLVMLAAPYQFVADERFPHGMGVQTFSMFRENFTQQPERTRSRFAGLIAKGDRHQKQVMQAVLQQQSQLPIEGINWLSWLDELGTDRPVEPLSQMSETKVLLVHGQQDAIVDIAQHQHWLELLPQSQELILPDAAHAPHLHDPEAVRLGIANLLREAA